MHTVPTTLASVWRSYVRLWTASELRWGKRKQRDVKSWSNTEFLPTQPVFLPPTHQDAGWKKKMLPLSAVFLGPESQSGLHRAISRTYVNESSGLEHSRDTSTSTPTSVPRIGNCVLFLERILRKKGNKLRNTVAEMRTGSQHGTTAKAQRHHIRELQEISKIIQTFNRSKNEAGTEHGVSGWTPALGRLKQMCPESEARLQMNKQTNFLVWKLKTLIHVHRNSLCVPRWPDDFPPVPFNPK